MILDNVEILDSFSPHFNCRMASLDFIDNVAGLVSILNNKSEAVRKSVIYLPCSDYDEYSQLVKFNYGILLNEICIRITLNEHLLDIYRSEMQIELVDLFIDYLINARSSIEIKPNPKTLSFEIICQDLFANLTISAFSQFHSEIIGQLEYFNRYIAVNSRTSDPDHFTDNLFVNSKVSTGFSYFIIAFLAENLKIRLKL